MKKLPTHQGWCASRYRHALVVGAALFSMAQFETCELHAGWISSPFGQRTDATVGREAGQGYVPVIRQMVDEARTLEADGQYDRAILLADRAQRLSRTSSSIKKQAPDLAPETLEKFANELRLKKADRSLHRMAGTQTHGSRSKENSDPKTVSDGYTATNPVIVTPQPKGVVPKNLTQTVDSKSASKSSSSNTEANRPQFSSKLQVVSSNNRGTKQTSNAIVLDGDGWSAMPKTSKSESQPIDDGSDLFTQVDQSDRSAQPASNTKAASSNDGDEWNAEASPADTTESPWATVATESPKAEAAQVEDEQKPVTKSRGLKLRQRFETVEPFFAPPTESTATDTMTTDDLPTIMPLPRATAAKGRKTSQEQVLVKNEDWSDDTSSESLARKSTKSAPAASSQSEHAGTPWSEELESEFPAERVKELRKKLETAISLKPGQIAGDATTEHVAISGWDQPKSEMKAQIRRIRLRKVVRKTPEQILNLAEQIPIQSAARQTVVSQAAMVKWRSVRKDEKSAFSGDFDRKSAKLTNDLRQSLRENSMNSLDLNPTTSEIARLSPPKIEGSRGPVSGSPNRIESAVKSNASSAGKKPTLRGTLWDNASVPTAAGFSGSIGGSGHLMNSQAVDLGYAPKPPADSMVEQTSFDSPAELQHSRLTVQDQFRSAADLEASDSHSGRTASAEPATPSKPASGISATISNFFSGPKSSTSSLFGAAGVALFFVGIWVAHETIRAKSH